MSKRYFLIFILLLLTGFKLSAQGESVNQKFPFPGEVEQVNNSHLNDSHPAFYHEEPDSFQDKFFRMLYLLAMLIGLMIAASWVLRRLMHKRVEQMNVSNAIKVLETRPLSPKSNLYLVEVNGKGLLIGESHAGIHSLGEVSLDETE